MVDCVRGVDTMEPVVLEKITNAVEEAKIETNAKARGYVDVESMVHQLGFARINTDVLPANIVAVMYLNLTGKFSIDIGSKKLIATNKVYDEFHQRFAIAHELGHFFIHAREKCHEDNWEHPAYAQFQDDGDYLAYAMTKDNEEKIEAEANRFAAILLMEEKSFTEALEEAKSKPGAEKIDIIEILSEKFGAPKSAVKRRVEELGLAL